MSRRPEWWLPFLAKIWPITWISARLTALPVIGPVFAASVLPMFSNRNFHVSYIPINEPLTGPENIPLPAMVVEELIRRSSHRVIIGHCTCRDAKQCSHHPVAMGCTLLGEGTREIDPRIARHVSIDEAIGHLHKTLEEGLMPMLGRVRIDNFIWGVRDRGKLLTICHCCRCCCTILQSGKYLPAQAAASIIPLAGIHIISDPEKCKACGTCEQECFMGAIRLENNKIFRDVSRCKHCGRCATVCPNGAVEVFVDDAQATVEALLHRIGSIVNYQ